MSNLSKFYSIWKDLEKSYEELKVKLSVDTRGDFLRKICFNNKNESIIPTIKSLLQNELESYSDEDLVKYSDLVESLDAISFLIETEQLEYAKIQNLNSLIIIGANERKDSTIEKKVTNLMICESCILKDDIEMLSSASMFGKYGEILPFTKLYRNRIINVGLKEDFSTGFFGVSEEGLSQFKNRMDTLKLDKPKEKEANFLSALCDVLFNDGISPNKYEVFCRKDNLLKGKIFGRKVKEISNDTVLYNDITIHLI